MIAMEQGKVKWYNETKGYGFIEKDSDGKDIFVHVSGIMREGGSFALKEGDRVTFEIAVGPKGPKAIGVRRT